MPKGCARILSSGSIVLAGSYAEKHSHILLKSRKMSEATLEDWATIKHMGRGTKGTCKPTIPDHELIHSWSRIMNQMINIKPIFTIKPNHQLFYQPWSSIVLCYAVQSWSIATIYWPLADHETNDNELRINKMKIEIATDHLASITITTTSATAIATKIETSPPQWM